MKTNFKEYHQYTEQEFKKLWEDCVFVFDTNTLLNMYRYSRKTVNKYFDVLTELKSKNKIWIPHQVGYEFFENRISVISDYEKSYDEILSTLNSTKESIDKKYKNHPFLDWKEVKSKIDKGLESVINDITKKKSDHPRWLEQDDILEKIKELFDGNVGVEYDSKTLCKIKQEGEERYSKKIPPGFKDFKKPEDEKYGDLILWKQIIDKAKEIKKPIIFISGDIKEDWWLEKDGKRIMPLPQLKKEMIIEAQVDFHIYTADRFLENYQREYTKNTIDKVTIDEVRKIRELEEKRLMQMRMFLSESNIHRRNLFTHKGANGNYHLFIELERMLTNLQHLDIHPRYNEDIFDLSRKLHRILERLDAEKFNKEYMAKVRHVLTKIKHIALELLHDNKYGENTRRQATSIANVIDDIFINNIETFM